MALSGSFSNSIRNGGYTLRVDWSAAQSVAGNTSVLTLVPYLVQGSNMSLYIGARSNTSKINGTDYAWNSPAISNEGSRTTKLDTITSSAIAHNADGTKSVSVSVTFKIQATIAGTYYESITASATLVLDTIARATTPNITWASIPDQTTTAAYFTNVVNINTPRASSSFTHDLYYQFANAGWVWIAGGVTTAYKNWTIPDLSSKIPEKPSGTLYIRCVTKNGSTVVGTKDITIAITVPSYYLPTVKSVTVTDTHEATAKQIGAFVTGKSKLKVDISAEGHSGSYITAYESTFDNAAFTTQSWTKDATIPGTRAIKVRVKDSRGRWSDWYTKNIEVLSYSQPTISLFNAYRVDEDGNTDENGEYLAISYNYAVASLGGKNTGSATIKYKQATETSYKTLLTISGASASGTQWPKNVTFSTDYQHDILLTVTDYYGTETPASVLILSGAVIIDINAEGTGIAIGKTSEREGIELGWDLAGTIAAAGLLMGQYKTHDGLLIQWSTVNVVTTKSNTPVASKIDFLYPYAQDPLVVVTPRTATPHLISCSTTRDTNVVPDAKTALGIYVSHADNATRTTAVSWLAIGLAAE